MMQISKIRLGIYVLLLLTLAASCSASTSTALALPLAEQDATTATNETPNDNDTTAGHGAADATPAQPTDESVSSDPAAPAQQDEPTVATAAADDNETAQSIEPAEVVAEPPAGPVILPGLGAIVQLTPATGNGTRPLLAWEAVDGAEFYSLVLYAPDGQPYWSSFLIETETFVGGPIQIEETKPGPRVGNDMTWSVVALDTDLLPVASSPLRPIAP